MFTITADEDGYAVYAAGHLVQRFDSLADAQACVAEIEAELSA